MTAVFLGPCRWTIFFTAAVHALCCRNCARWFPHQLSPFFWHLQLHIAQIARKKTGNSGPLEAPVLSRLGAVVSARLRLPIGPVRTESGPKYKEQTTLLADLSLGATSFLDIALSHASRGVSSLGNSWKSKPNFFRNMPYLQ